MKNKGKVHPFSSTSSPNTNDSSSPNTNDSSSPHLSVLNLLPAAIFTLLSVLSLEERHVLAYMITRSLKSTTAPTERKPKKKQQQSGPVIIDSHGRGHDGGGGALFDCDCFHCYTTFWFRWDSSPNRELIHKAIEAFEDNGDHHQFKKNVTSSWKSKRKGKSGRREELDKKMNTAAVMGGPPEESHEKLVNNVVPLETHDGMMATVDMKVDAASPPASSIVNNHNHKGLARKMLPDVMGIFNSRLWSLWSPNV